MKELIIILLLILSLSCKSQYRIGRFTIQDSDLHCSVGNIISFGTGVLIKKMWSEYNWKAILGSFIAGVSAANFKEYIYDKAWHKGVFSYEDIFYTYWGTIIGTLCTLIYCVIKDNKLNEELEKFEDLNYIDINRALQDTTSRLIIKQKID